jgi:hypothetical protein
VGGDSQFWWGIEFLANKLTGFDSRTVQLLCTYICTLNQKTKNTLLSIVAPPGSYPYTRSILTKPMLQIFQLDPKLEVLYEEVGLWGEWWWGTLYMNALLPRSMGLIRGIVLIWNGALRDSNSSRTPPVLMDLVGAGRDVIARASEVDPQCVCIDL